MQSKFSGFLTALALILTIGLLTIQILASKFKPINEWVATRTYAEITPTRTPRPVVTPRPTATPEQMVVDIPNPTAAPNVGPVQGTLVSQQIKYQFDDVNQDGIKLRSEKQMWIGTGSVPASSWLGLRFTGVPVSRFAKIISAKLTVYAPTSQKGYLDAVVYGEASGNCLSFSSNYLPSARNLTKAVGKVSGDVNWRAGNWYQLSDVTSVISEIVGNDGWRSGNSIGLMIKGLAANPNNKFFIGNFDNDPNLSAKLTINYSR